MVIFGLVDPFARADNKGVRRIQRAAGRAADQPTGVRSDADADADTDTDWA